MKASPWSKYFCASGLDVATDRVCTPRPVYWMTLDWDAPSGPVGSLSTELGPTAIAAESPINMRMFVNRKMRPPFIFVSSLVTNGIGVLLFCNSSCLGDSARAATRKRVPNRWMASDAEWEETSLH